MDSNSPPEQVFANKFLSRLKFLKDLHVGFTRINISASKSTVAQRLPSIRATKMPSDGHPSQRTEFLQLLEEGPERFGAGPFGYQPETSPADPTGV